MPYLPRINEVKGTLRTLVSAFVRQPLLERLSIWCHDVGSIGTGDISRWSLRAPHQYGECGFQCIVLIPAHLMIISIRSTSAHWTHTSYSQRNDQSLRTVPSDDKPANEQGFADAATSNAAYTAAGSNSTFDSHWRLPMRSVLSKIYQPLITQHLPCSVRFQTTSLKGAWNASAVCGRRSKSWIDRFHSTNSRPFGQSSLRTSSRRSRALK